MTKTSEVINLGHRNKRNFSRIYVLNNLNNYNTSNVSFISSNDFNSTKYGKKINNSFISKTTKSKNTRLINFRPTSIETKVNIDKINFFKNSNVPKNLDVLNLILIF